MLMRSNCLIIACEPKQISESHQLSTQLLFSRTLIYTHLARSNITKAEEVTTNLLPPAGDAHSAIRLYTMSDWKGVAESAWDCNEVDWNEYESHRPPYTQELYDLVFEHHGDQRKELALDVGAGGGTVTRVLLKHFSHVIFSDPSTEYISRAQKRFSREADAGRVTFLQRRFNELDPKADLPSEGQLLDMITAGTCIHFGEPARIMAQLHPMLRVGGTVAAFSYGSVPVLPHGDPAGPIVKKCKDKVMRWIHENVAPVNTAEATGTGQARYNNVDFDPAMWKNVRRITSLANESIWPDWIEPAVSRVRSGESLEQVHDGIISKEVTYAFFPTYFSNLAPPLPILDQIQEELEQLRVAMGERKILAKWPLVLVLATRV